MKQLVTLGNAKIEASTSSSSVDPQTEVTSQLINLSVVVSFQTISDITDSITLFRNELYFLFYRSYFFCSIGRNPSINCQTEQEHLSAKIHGETETKEINHGA